MSSDNTVTAYVRFVLPIDLFEKNMTMHDAVVSYIHEHLDVVCLTLAPLVVAIDGESCCAGFSSDKTRRMGSAIAAAHRAVHPKDETVGSLKEENARLKRELEALKRAESRRPF